MTNISVLMSDMFYEVMEEWAALGACDTEPRAIFSEILHEFYQTGKVPLVPMTGRGWQLYSDNHAADVAGQDLYRQTHAILAEANRNYTGFRNELRYYYGTE